MVSFLISLCQGVCVGGDGSVVSLFILACNLYKLCFLFFFLVMTTQYFFV